MESAATHKVSYNPALSTQVTSDAPGGLIASGVGTGKTAIAVTYALTKATLERPVLVVVPRQVEQQWADEFQRVGATMDLDGPVKVVTQRAAVKPPKKVRRVGAAREVGGAREEAGAREVGGAPIVVWRCMTVSNSRKPPPGWSVLLVTYTFVERRFDALRAKSPTFDYDEWVRVAPGYCAQHCLETAFHDRRWGAIVYDEVEEVISQRPVYVHRFLNTIPAEHVWALSSTPVHHERIGEFLRMRRSSPIHRVNPDGSPGEDATLRCVLAGQDPWPAMLMARSIRYGKDVMSHVHVRHRVAPLELGRTERDVLGFMSSQGFRMNALVCTDVAALMANLVEQRRRHVGYDEPRQELDMEAVVSRITSDTFWRFMECDVTNRLAEARAKLARLADQLNDAEMVLGALGENTHEHAQVKRDVHNLNGRIKTAEKAVERYAAQEGYIQGLHERVQEAQSNPCPICMDTIAAGDMAVTPCTHIFCVGCVFPWVASHRKCPMCRQVVLAADIKVIDNRATTVSSQGAATTVSSQGATTVSSPSEPAAQDGAPESILVQPTEPPSQESPESADESPEELLLNYSTKIRFLITQLRVLCTQTDDKAIVFCDYPNTAATIQDVLTREGITSTNLTGSLQTKNRKLRFFKGVDECRVLFLHTQTQNSGMDLFNANHIFFVNPVLSHDVVQQAIGRCVRLSQTKDVNVTFLTVPEVEELPDLRAALGPFYEAAEGVPGEAAESGVIDLSS